MSVSIYLVIIIIIECSRILRYFRSIALDVPGSITQEKTEKTIHNSSKDQPLAQSEHNECPDQLPLYSRFSTYISFGILVFVGLCRDFFGKIFRPRKYQYLMPQDGYAALNPGFDNFYLRRIHARMDDCFERVTTGVPGRHITLVNQAGGKPVKTLNLSSYNYLGFADSEGPCASFVEKSIRDCGISSASTRAEVGTQSLHIEVEELVASYVGKPAAIISSMGFGTNSSVFTALVGKDCLVLSDELNHASIRFGARASGATIRTFKHNSLLDLERTLRNEAMSSTKWRKVLVVVEGLYSMEGSMCDLPGLVALKKRYKFYLFVDEAHSIGAIGPNGKGVCDYFGVAPAEVDVLMGTFTKSFGAIGGYIASDHGVISKLRATDPGFIYSEAPAPAVLAQILSSIEIIVRRGEGPNEGGTRLEQLLANSRYLRRGLQKLGLLVYGNEDSPVIPVLLLNPAKMPAFSREMLQRKISVVVVGYPATSLHLARVRFCVSATHTKADLDYVIQVCEELCHVLQLRLTAPSQL
jgi:serine palmitoyltransferase